MPSVEGAHRAMVVEERAACRQRVRRGVRVVNTGVEGVDMAGGRIRWRCHYRGVYCERTERGMEVA